MKLTEEKLKQMILESMYSPSTLIDDAIADPDVHPQIKSLLSSESEADKRSGLQLLDTLYGDKYPQGTADHVHLGSEKYKDSFKKSLPPNAVVENELEDFYNHPYRPAMNSDRRLRIKYDPRFGGEITVVTRRLHGEDLRHLQLFIQHLIEHGFIVTTPEEGPYNFSSVVRVQYN